MEPSTITNQLQQWTSFLTDLGPLSLIILLTPGVWFGLHYVPVAKLKAHITWLSMLFPAIALPLLGAPGAAPHGYSSPTACYICLGLVIGVGTTIARRMLPKAWVEKLMPKPGQSAAKPA